MAVVVALVAAPLVHNKKVVAALALVVVEHSKIVEEVHALEDSMQMVPLVVVAYYKEVDKRLQRLVVDDSVVVEQEPDSILMQDDCTPVLEHDTMIGAEREQEQEQDDVGYFGCVVSRHQSNDRYHCTLFHEIRNPLDLRLLSQFVRLWMEEN